MTLDELITEGDSLARPSWVLRTQPTEPVVAGFWGGERGDVPNALPLEVTAYRRSQEGQFTEAKTGPRFAA
jgi:hypothetical protein